MRPVANRQPGQSGHFSTVKAEGTCDRSVARRTVPHRRDYP